MEDFYLLAGIAPPDIIRDVFARMEQTKQMEQETHFLFGHIPAIRRLKSWKDFLTSVKPSYFHAKVVRCNEWQSRSRDKSPLGMVNLNEELAKGYDYPWLTWRCLHRLRTGCTCSKEQRKKWGYFNGDTTCACVLDSENTAHYGIKGSAYNLLESYLVKREQYVKFKNYNSKQIETKLGVPQGPFLAHYCFVSTLTIWFLLVIR